MYKTNPVSFCYFFLQVRKLKFKHTDVSVQKSDSPSPLASANTSPTYSLNKPRRPSTPSLAVQISALRSPRNIKTRGLALAVKDPEIEKMAKLAVILREVCNVLQAVKGKKW